MAIARDALKTPSNPNKIFYRFPLIKLQSWANFFILTLMDICKCPTVPIVTNKLK
ncbi:hypothetical protein NTGBS_580024 [Candidatus Nitrotoga sp. BS]|nr:hypothetical protein NTGBS_580024 [Candidatus Nitrotoga sp. BS]